MDDNAHPPGEGEPVRASLFARARKPAAAPPPREPKKKRPRRAGLASLSGVLSFVLVGVFVGLAAFVGVLVAERKAGPLTEDKTVLLTREDDDGPIGDQLEKAGVIENSTLFYLMTLLDGQRSALKRGIPFIPRSTGTVTSRSISSAEWPGHWVITSSIGGERSG